MAGHLKLLPKLQILEIKGRAPHGSLNKIFELNLERLDISRNEYHRNNWSELEKLKNLRILDISNRLII